MPQEQPYLNPDLKAFRVFVNGRPRGVLSSRPQATQELHRLIRDGEKRTVEVRGQKLGGGWHIVVCYKNGKRC
jgi:hypothetical protein